MPPKVKVVYRAVIALFVEGADLNSLTVAEIAGKAGIGKGTVYEYFKNKEQMIAGALFYQMNECCENVYAQLAREKSLYDRMNKILLNIDKERTEISFFIRALPVMMDNSTVSGRLRELWKDRGEEEAPVMELMRRLIEDEVKPVKELNGKDTDYLILTVLSRIICYAVYRFGGRGGLGLDEETMREMICMDICRDVDSIKGL